MKNKPCKWGFKYWVIANTSGYTLDFDLYTGKMVQEKKNERKGWLMMSLCSCARLSNFRVILCLLTIFTRELALFEDLAKMGIAATGTLRIDRKGVPDGVKQLQKALSASNVPQGDGYYIREGSLVYVCW